MGKRRLQVWLFLVLVAWGTGLMMRQWEAHRNAENTIIVDMIEEGQEKTEPRDCVDDGWIITVRLIADAGGTLLLILGSSVMIRAIGGFRRGD